MHRRPRRVRHEEVYRPWSLAAVATAQPFVGRDQAALAQMLQEMAAVPRKNTHPVVGCLRGSSFPEVDAAVDVQDDRRRGPQVRDRANGGRAGDAAR